MILQPELEGVGLEAQAQPCATPAWKTLRRVSASDGLETVTARLAEVQAWLSPDLRALEAKLDALVQASTAQRASTLAGLAAGHLLQRPGKRVRPLCTMLAARFGSADPERVRELALAAEIVHAATLLHDDVIDEGHERRGAEASRVVYGNSASILGGDQLFVEALRRVHSAGTPGLLEEMFEVIARMVAGEALQLELRGSFQPDRGLYLRVAHGKTTSLFRWALRAGGTVAGLDEPALTALGRAALALGLAFQLVDDLLDLSADPELLGKDLYADLKQGKLTWPLIVAAERDPALSGELRQLAAGHARPIPRLLEQVRQSGALEATRDFVAYQRDEALTELARLPECAAREALETLVRVVVARAH